MVNSITTTYSLKYHDFERMMCNIIDTVDDDNSSRLTRDLATDVMLFLSTLLEDLDFLIPKFCGGQLDISIEELWVKLTEGRENGR